MREITISTGWKDRTPFDLDNFFGYAEEAPFDLPCSARLHACVMGENDEYNWYWIFEVEGQVYYADGWCDYTGWDCQSGGQVVPVDDVDSALMKAPEVEAGWSNTGRIIRKWLTDQVEGKLQIGVVVEEAK